MTARYARELNSVAIGLTKDRAVKLVPTNSVEHRVCRAILKAPASKRTHLVKIHAVTNLGGGATAIVMERLTSLERAAKLSVSDADYRLMLAQLRALGYEHVDKTRDGHNVMWDEKRAHAKLIDFDHVERVESHEKRKASEEVVTLSRSRRKSASTPKPAPALAVPPVLKVAASPVLPPGKRDEFGAIVGCECNFCRMRRPAPKAPEVKGGVLRDEVKLGDPPKLFIPPKTFGDLAWEAYALNGPAPGANRAPVCEVSNPFPPSDDIPF